MELPISSVEVNLFRDVNSSAWRLNEVKGRAPHPFAIVLHYFDMQCHFQVTLQMAFIMLTDAMGPLTQKMAQSD